MEPNQDKIEQNYDKLKIKEALATYETQGIIRHTRLPQRISVYPVISHFMLNKHSS